MNLSAQERAFPLNSRVDIYVRCSTGDQSIASQLNYMREWFAREELLVGEIFIDEAKSGTTVAGRAAFLRLLEKFRRLAKQPDRPAGVAFWDFKRFARDYDDAQYYKADLRRSKYIVHSVTDNIPPGLVGRLVEAVHDYKNAIFIEELRRDIKRALDYLTTNGYMAAGAPPTGFRRGTPIELGKKKNGTVQYARKKEIDPTRQAAVATAWRMKLAGDTHREIHEATHLFAHVQFYSQMFCNPAYAGAEAAGGIVTWDAHPAYITRAEFELVQARRKKRAKRGELLQDTSRHGARRKANNPFLLSGLLECGLCHHWMSGTSSSQHRLYRCDWQHRRSELRVPCAQKSIRAAAVHEPLIAWLAGEVLTYERLQECRAEANEILCGNNPELAQRLAQLEENKTRLESALKNLMTAIESRGYTPSLQARLDERLSELNQLETELAAVKHTLRAGEVLVSDEALRVLCDSLQDRLHRFLELGAKELRDLLQSVLTRAELAADALNVEYSLFPLLGSFVGNEPPLLREGLHSPQILIKTHILPIQRRAPGSLAPDAGAYLRPVLEAVQAGVITSRHYADLHGLSINTASFHFQQARRRQLIEPSGRFADGIHFRLKPSEDGCDD